MSDKTEKNGRGGDTMNSLVRCPSCRFWEDVGNRWEGFDLGICHRLPPVEDTSSIGDNPSTQPTVTSGDWCGEFLPNAPMSLQGSERIQDDR